MKLMEEFRREYQELPEHQKQTLKQRFILSGALLVFAFLYFLLFYL